MNRRDVVGLGIGFVGTVLAGPAFADDGSLADQLEFPPYETIENQTAFGFSKPDEAQVRRAEAIVSETTELIASSNPRMGPVDVAASFIERFRDQPELISQWPAPSAWNPLVVTFLRSTGYPANNDMIAWCAAFLNWCIEKSLDKRHTSASASSQSFLKSARFRATSSPKRGDIAVFTIYQKGTMRPVTPPLGHVAFVSEPPTANRVKLLGGNQSGDGHLSIICEKSFPTSPFPARRHINGNYVACTMGLNKFLSIVV